VLPIALWAQAEDIGSEAFRQATVVVSDDPTVVAAAGARGLRAPTGRPIGHRRPMSPFVRERLRRERGLPALALLEQREEGWLFGRPSALLPLESDLVETAMGSASAVVVTEPGWLLRSLAWGAPTVTSPATAAAVGAVAGTEVLVAETSKARTEAAVALCADDLEAARFVVARLPSGGVPRRRASRDVPGRPALAVAGHATATGSCAADGGVDPAVAGHTDGRTCADQTDGCYGYLDFRTLTAETVRS